MITADTSMYRSKRAGKNRVTGVPLSADGEVGEPVFDHGADVPPPSSRRAPSSVPDPTDAIDVPPPAAAARARKRSGDSV